jgi:two-component system, NtrC family, response regulator GlrR
MDRIGARILVVDDDRNLLELIKMRLESLNYEVTTSLTETEARKAVNDASFDLSIVDLQLGDYDGITLMEEFHAINPGMPVIILTAHGSIESAVEAMKKGAYTYITKPFEAKELGLQIERALENKRLTSEIKRLKDLLREGYAFENIVARSNKMQRLLEMVSRVAKTESTIYIHGESGTGKELIAKAIHLESTRNERPFVAVNCAAIPESLIESELFGHEKGAFTGAVKSTKGLFVQAHEGTIFLDEIGDLPLATQSRFLRILQERQCCPLGSEKPIDVDVRVIVATNKDLEELVSKGLFREDLFYRIHVIPILLPPLRERKEDIPLLVEHFLRKLNRKMKKNVNGLTSMALQRLMHHEWPGNVRELENTLEYAVAMTRDNVIPDDLILPTKAKTPELKTLREAREEFEKEYLTNLVKLTEGNVTRAAEMAGKYRADFYNLLKKYNIQHGDYKK